MTQFKSQDWQNCKVIIKERLRNLSSVKKKKKRATWKKKRSTLQVILVLLGNPEDVRFK
jgi:hypothetical protein